MAQDMEQPPRGYTTADVRAQSEPVKRRRWWPKLMLYGVFLPLVLFVLYTFGTLKFVYSSGERSGFVQKLSKKGWPCKTWEGELAMANLPGTMPEIFHFTVRNDSVAQAIVQHMGPRVTLHYQEHRGVPTTCFGDTQTYVDGIQLGGGPS